MVTLEKRVQITLLTLSVILAMTESSPTNAIRGIRALYMAQDYMANGLLRRLSTNARAEQELIPTTTRETQGNRGIQMQKRFFHTKLKTKGYEPKEPPTTYQFHTLKLPKRLEYVDDTYEVFRAPPGFQEMLEESVKRSHAEQPLPAKVEKKK